MNQAILQGNLGGMSPVEFLMLFGLVTTDLFIFVELIRLPQVRSKWRRLTAIVILFFIAQVLASFNIIISLVVSSLWISFWCLLPPLRLAKALKRRDLTILFTLCLGIVGLYSTWWWALALSTNLRCLVDVISPKS